MAYSTIKDPSAHFYAYAFSKSSGTGSATFDGNSDLQPDFLWVKSRTNADSHELWDSTRGVNSTLFSDSTSAEDTAANRIVSFDTDGFTWGNAGNLNAAGDFVSWAWKANGGTTSTNTDGSITTTTQVNSDAGFSIVTWAGGGTGSLGHGLGVVPDMWIVKNRDYAVSWPVGFSGPELGGTSNYLNLNTSGANSTYNNLWGSSPANSSIITMAGDRSVNISGDDYVGYFFKGIQGYSKFGKYVGNGNADGPFVYTGFKPAFLIMKETSSSGGNWVMFDNKRDTHNVTKHRLFPNLTNSDNTTRNYIDLLSNGFKLRDTDFDHNQSGETMIYMAFAENPFVTSTGVPTTAR